MVTALSLIAQLDTFEIALLIFDDAEPTNTGLLIVVFILSLVLFTQSYNISFISTNVWWRNLLSIIYRNIWINPNVHWQQQINKEYGKSEINH